MSITRNAIRSDQEWLDLITECRQSGMTDKSWCEINSIPASSFYNAVSRLRRKSCRIPEQQSHPVMDLTSRKQDVVQIDIVPDEISEPVTPVTNGMTAQHLDNPHTIELFMGDGASLRISNSADPLLLEKVIGMLRRASC